MIMINYSIWMDNFITESNDCYVAWDETQANELGSFPTHEEAVEAIILYARTLN